MSVSSDRSTCELNGTPTTLQSSTAVDISARNVTGTSVTSLRIEVLTVIDAPVLEVVVPQIYTLRQTITPLPLGNSGGGELTACNEITPLPDGLNVAVTNDRSTCEISGTPTTILPVADYVIRATNREGSSEITLSIAVNDIVFTESLTFALSNSQSLTLGLAVTSGTARIDWGDGSATVDVTNQDIAELINGEGRGFYSYPTAMDVNVTIRFSEGVASLLGLFAGPRGNLDVDLGTLVGASNLEVLNFSFISNRVTGDMSDLITNTPSLRELSVGRGGNLSGDITNLPRNLSVLSITNGRGALSGSVDNLPPSLTTFALSESNTINGDIGNLPTALESFTLEGGTNRVTGSIEGLPSTLTRFDLQGLNTVFGNINGIHSNFDVIEIGGQNTIGGDIGLVVNNSQLIVRIQGQNEITGDVASIPNAITILQLTNGNNTLFGDIQSLHPDMQNFAITGDNVIAGDLSQLQSNTSISINILGDNSIAGDIGTLSSAITSLTLWGRNSLSGNIQDLGTNISFFDVDGVNTISGDIGLLDVSTLTQFVVQGQNTITGNIVNLLGSNILNRLTLTGMNTVSGDISSVVNTLVSTISIEGENVLSGTLNNILTSARLGLFRVNGQNTLSGDVVAAINPSRTVTIELNGQNTLSGDIGTLDNTSVRRLIIGGQNTLSGDIGLMMISQPDTIEISGLNEINQFTLPSNWTPPRLFRRLVLTGGGTSTGFDMATIDAALIFLNDNTGGTSLERNISFSRIGDAPRTSASDAAVTALQGKRFEVNTNPTPM